MARDRVKQHDGKPVGRFCPACRDGVNVRGILVYKRIYLCELHRGAWDSADAADRGRRGV